MLFFFRQMLSKLLSTVSGKVTVAFNSQKFLYLTQSASCLLHKGEKDITGPFPRPKELNDHQRTPSSTRCLVLLRCVRYLSF